MIGEDGVDKRFVQLELVCEADGVAPLFNLAIVSIIDTSITRTFHEDDGQMNQWLSTSDGCVLLNTQL